MGQFNERNKSFGVGKILSRNELKNVYGGLNGTPTCGQVCGTLKPCGDGCNCQGSASVMANEAGAGNCVANVT